MDQNFSQPGGEVAKGIQIFHLIQLLFALSHPFKRNAIMPVSKKILELHYSYKLICFVLGDFFNHKSEETFDAKYKSFVVDEHSSTCTRLKTAICK